MTAIAAARPPVPVALDVRPWRGLTPSEQAYVLDSWAHAWRQQWRQAQESRTSFVAQFDSLVRRGVCEQPDTHVVLATAPADDSWIWAWLVYTPPRFGAPTVHYALVRNAIADDEGAIHLRGKGVLWLMLAAAGVRDRMVYTFRPKTTALEQRLVARCEANGITTMYRPIDDLLSSWRDA